MYFACNQQGTDIILVIFNSTFLIQTNKTYIELDPGTGKKKKKKLLESDMDPLALTD